MNEQEYVNLLSKVKQAHKPRLKTFSKNQLINMIVELSTELSVYRQSSNFEEQKKEESND